MFFVAARVNFDNCFFWQSLLSSKPTRIRQGKQFYGCRLMEQKAERESRNQRNFVSAAEYILVFLQLLDSWKCIPPTLSGALELPWC